MIFLSSKLLLKLNHTIRVSETIQQLEEEESLSISTQESSSPYGLLVMNCFSELNGELKNL